MVPRTSHFPWSLGATRADLVLLHPRRLEACAMIGSEALDFEDWYQSACLLLA